MHAQQLHCTQTRQAYQWSLKRHNVASPSTVDRRSCAHNAVGTVG